jgi:hypothetical protein
VGQPLAFFHVLAFVVKDTGVVASGNLARVVGGMRVSQEDLVCSRE